MSLETATETATNIDSIGDERPSRRKSDYGNIVALASSLAIEGQRHPVLIMPNGELLKGGRRVAAARTLGWTTIAAREVRYLEDAVDALYDQRDELSLPRSVEEVVSLGLALETLDRRDSKALGDSTQFIGGAVAASGSAYKRARYVVQASRSNNRSAYVVEVAKQAVAAIDAGTMKITTAYLRVRGAEKAAPAEAVVDDGLPAIAPPSPAARSPRARLLREEWVRALALKGASSQQIADRLGITVPGMKRIAAELGVVITADLVLTRTKQKGVDPSKAMRVAIDDLDALVWSLDRIDPTQLDPEQADEWARMLAGYARALSKTSRNIKGAIQ